MRKYILVGCMVVGAVLFFRLKTKPAPAVQSNSVYVPPSFSEEGTSLFVEDIQSTAGSGLGQDELGKLIEKSVREADVKISNTTISMGVTSHHLPTASPLIAEFYKTLSQNKGPRDTFVILGPDHYEACGSTVSTTYSNYQTPFGELSISPLAKELGIHEESNCFKNEHAITVQANYIKYFYPNAKIVPVIFSSRATEDDVQKVKTVLEKHTGEYFLIGSLDFNHYHSLEVANASDRNAARAILELDADRITKSMLDSLPAIRLLLGFARQQHLQPHIIKNVNSYIYTGLPENTTSYMNIIF